MLDRESFRGQTQQGQNQISIRLSNSLGEMLVLLLNNNLKNRPITQNSLILLLFRPFLCDNPAVQTHFWWLPQCPTRAHTVRGRKRNQTESGPKSNKGERRHIRINAYNAIQRADRCCATMLRQVFQETHGFWETSQRNHFDVFEHRAGWGHHQWAILLFSPQYSFPPPKNKCRHSSAKT